MYAFVIIYNMTTYTLIQAISYLGLIGIAVYCSFKNGEKSGSMYMLEYLRETKYKNTNGHKVPFLDDTGFNQFMVHMRKEKQLKDE